MSRAVAVFASGSGSNLQSILDHFHHHAPGRARVALVVSDRDDAGALARGAAAGVRRAVIPTRGRAEADVAAETLAALDAAGAEIIALAGYLRLVPAAVVARYRGRLINIHPSLLPAFGGAGMYGARVHRAVLASGCTVSGATVHQVDEVYDRGQIIAQWPVPVLPADDAATLAARVLAVEHRLYPAALDWLVGALEAGAAAPHFAPSATDPAATTGFALSRGAGIDADAVRSLIRVETS